MKNNEKKEILSHTIVLHQARKKLGITLLEYCIADSIYHLSNNPKSQIPGWCYASKQTIGNFLGVDSQVVWRHLTLLIDKRIVEKNQDNRQFLKTTSLWYDTVVLLKLKLRGQME